MVDNPFYYSDPTDENPIVRQDPYFCETFRSITEAVAAGAMTLEASSEHVRNCPTCRGYLATARAAKPKPIDAVDDEIAELI